MRLRPLLSAATVLGLAVQLVAAPPPAVAAPPSSPTPAAAAAAGPRTAAEVYRYLEDPRMTGEGQQAPHTALRPYPDARTAAGSVQRPAQDRATPDTPSPWVASLDGDWRLRLFDRPDDVPADFPAAGYDVSGWPTAQVPHTWQADFIDHPMFRNIAEEVWPDSPPLVPHDVNPTGAYVRTVQIPRSWDGRRTFLRFEGVTSGYFVWVNGQYLGYDQGGYTPAEFDATDALRPGANRVAVQVHRWGSGSYLEDVDQWRYSGIFRDVWLYSTPQTRLTDAYLTTDLDAGHRDATLTARVTVAGPDRAGYTVRGTLRDAGGRPVTTIVSTVDNAGRATLTGTVSNPAKWSAEAPNLYPLVLELLDPAGRVVHTTAQAVGFRDIAVQDRQILVNGERILVKGVNRAETDPDTGRHVTRAAQYRDVMLLKQLHVNAVRTSHYPSDPYLYDLADRYGLWVDDEIDIETHAHESCPSVCLASRPEWQDAFADRFQAMVARDKNHPSIIFWDTGNEAGLGTAHFAMADWADANEPTRLLYHQSNSPDGDAPYADVWGPRYPTPASLEQKALTTTKPIVMGEYAHAMGNGLGNFDQFWALARKYPQIQGGFIWDWAEQNLRQPLVLTPDSSPSRIQAFLVGKPEPAAGHRGQAVALSSLDDFVDTFRDPRLDVAGHALTLDAWVRPGSWTGSLPILTKGEQYGLQMRDAQTLEFGVQTGVAGTRTEVAAAVPADWYTAWHRVTGVYDGAALRLSIDGAQVATGALTGDLTAGLWEVNVGRNAQTQQDNPSSRLGHALVDDVRVYPLALTADQLAAGADPSTRAVLALDFDRYERRGDVLSLGLSLSGTDGLVGSDRYLQPETRELAWAQSPVRFTAPDAAGGRIRVHNEQQFAAVDLSLRWSLAEVDWTLRSGTRPLRLGPDETVDIDLIAGSPPANPGDTERWLNLTAVTTRDLPWAARGFPYAADQFSAGGRVVPGVLPAPGTRRAQPEPVFGGGEHAPNSSVRAQPEPGFGEGEHALSSPAAPQLTREGDSLRVANAGWAYRFDTATGALAAMDDGGAALLRSGPKLDVYRPPTSNETYDWGTDDRRVWHELGLDRLATTVTGVDTSTGPDAVVVEIRSTAAGPGTADLLSFDQTMRYRIDGQGTITLAHHVQAKGSRVSTLPYLPRVGFSVQVPDELSQFAWYGRGPQESYNDRKDGTPVGLYHSTVDSEYVRYSRPQAYGNHTDTRWASLTDGRRAGLLVGADTARSVDVSVTPYDALDRAEYDFQLPLVRNRDWSTLHVATGETGMGETPNSVLAPFRMSPDRAYDYQVTLRPLTRAEVRAGGVVDSRAAAPCPPDLAVATDGEVRAGEPEQVDVTVSPRCAAGLRDVAVALAAPEGWTVRPATAPPATVSAPTTASFTVTPPAGTDVGDYDLTATATFTSPPAFPGRVTAGARVHAPLPAGFTWLSDLPYTALENGWGPVERDMSNGEQPAGDGRPLSISGTGYAKGLGAHAVSRVQLALDGRCTVFRAEVGVDDEMGANGSVAFEVWLDGERRAASAVRTGGASAEHLSVDVTGGQMLELRVTDGGNGNGADHADWAAPRLACSP